MAWLCVDKDGTEVVCAAQPIRLSIGMWSAKNMNDEVELPIGSIEKLIGRTISWEDEPIKI